MAPHRPAPVRAAGSLETGSGAAQAALANLRQVVKAAGATLDDVRQVGGSRGTQSAAAGRLLRGWAM